MSEKNKKLYIHGIRGIPASHGGFETFAEFLAPYLVEHGWDVTVYCQELGSGAPYTDTWKGVELIHIPVSSDGTKGSILFDWLSVKDASRKEGLNLTLGYNTAVFSFYLRLKNKINLINMDGIEWKRQKWSKPIQAWFYINERLGCWLGNHLFADHPDICKHLETRVKSEKITTIPYGSDLLLASDPGILEQYEIEPNKYALIIARPEPENSIKEIVAAFSRKPRDFKLVVLGNYDPDEMPYHKEVLDAANESVKFVGAIYDQTIVNALRFYTRLYIHGHQVGGTNPSLVEMLGAGAPVLAHDNKFNRWVAGSGAHFFADEDVCSAEFDAILNDDRELDNMREASRLQHEKEFTWGKVLTAYDKTLTEWHQKIGA
ncbi:MAG: DUF1972 domain-containing protein [Gammaproteobacteria bacterium]